jgi:hypothetical protein
MFQASVNYTQPPLNAQCIPLIQSPLDTRRSMLELAWEPHCVAKTSEPLCRLIHHIPWYGPRGRTRLGQRDHQAHTLHSLESCPHHYHAVSLFRTIMRVGVDVRADWPGVRVLRSCAGEEGLLRGPRRGQECRRQGAEEGRRSVLIEWVCSVARDVHPIFIVYSTSISQCTAPHSITQAFRKLSLKYHPDRNADNSDKFVEINEAHEVCSV